LFALWYKLSPDKEASIKVLLDEFVRHNNHVSTGIFTTKMLFDVLRENDRNETAFTIASQKDYPGWGNMLANGATTLWETWKYPDSAPSQNHPMFGSIEEWFYKSLLGINAAEPGFKKIIIKPQPVAGISWAKGSYHSVNGDIKSNWKKEENNFKLEVTIPVNTTAEIWLPAGESKTVLENGKSIKEVQDVKLLRNEKKYMVISVGSGTYNFTTGE
jgi:alpha-L-rhamnosidase